MGFALGAIFDSQRSPAMQHLAPGKTLYVNVWAHVTHYLASSFLPCGFSGANPYWCRRFNQRKIWTWLVSRRWDLLPEEAIVTHLITCQGRDHIVNKTIWATKPSYRQRPF